MWVAHELHESSRGLHPLLTHPLSDGGKGWIEVSGEVEVVEAGKRDVLGNAQPARLDRFESTRGGRVVGAEDRVHSRVEELARRGNA
jgi:hypothetical protein